MKKFWIKIIVVSLPIIAVGLFNFICDPIFLLRGEGLSRDAAKLILNGEAVIYPERLDTCNFTLNIINSCQEKPSVIAFGSSLSMQLSKEQLKGENFLNLSVSGPGMYDITALWQATKESGITPQKIIISYGDWYFNDAERGLRYTGALTPYLTRFEQVDYSADNAVEKYITSLFSFEYLSNSMKYLKNGKRPVFSIRKATPDDNETWPVFMPDCSFRYPKSYLNRPRDTEKEKLVFERAANLKLYMLQNGYYNHDRAKDFKELVTDMQQTGANVIIFISPLHPIVYDEIEKNSGDYKYFYLQQDFIKQLSLETDAKIIGDFSPYSIDFTADDFIDELHITYSSLSRIWI